MDSSFIFHDPSGRRWRLICKGAQISGLLAALFLAVFASSMLISPRLPALALPGIEHLGNYAEVPSVIRGERVRLNRPFNLRPEVIKYVRSADPVIHRRLAAPVAPEQPLVFGFYVNWDPASKASLRANMQVLTHLVPEWLTLANGAGDLTDDTDGQVVRICRDAKLPILAMVTNFRNGWRGADVARAISSPERRETLIANIISNVEEHGFAGVMIDFEQVRRRDRANLVAFMTALKAALAPGRLTLAEAVPVDDDAFDLQQLSSAVDYLVPMLYDEHYQSGDPGPVASAAWFSGQVRRLEGAVPAAKTVVGIGNYGYDWPIGGSSAAELSFQQIMAAAQNPDAAVQWETQTGNPVLRYTTVRSRQRHEVWFLDAVTAANQMTVVKRAGFRGLGVWRLGGEDPDMWKLLATHHWPADKRDPSGLQELSALKIPNHYGDGEVLRVVATPRAGRRVVWAEAAGDLAERYQTFPSYYTLENSGPAADEGNQIVLTFDDGPDPAWTPRILDVLKQKHAPATFFVVGLNVESYPSLVAREFAEGHLIGNHTYSHPNVATLSEERMRLELDLTERLVENATGHATVLFRPPYNADSEPTTGDEVVPLWRAQQLNYTAIGERIDPQDWTPHITAAQIVSEVTEERHNGHIILLHDGGGDRSATLGALPQIIDLLRAKGYRFVGLDSLIGTSRAQLMPLPSQREKELATIAGRALVTKGSSGRLLRVLFLITSVLTVLRLFVFGCLAVVQKLRCRRAAAAKPYQGPVSIVIAAYNEAKVIRQTIDSLLQSDYPELEIVVVDDGSTDGTCDTLRSFYSVEPRVRVLRQKNGGKSSALNHAIDAARHHILVALDADTVFDRSCIRRLVGHFADPKVGAVSGNAKVGNGRKWITRFQSIEYVCGFNLDRRALALVNAITVVPGAVGAWRKDLLLAVGGFSSDTLAEDTDVTLAIRRLGYRINYEEQALAYTEAPETIRSLAKQRFRWAYGTLQAAWKHRSALFAPRYGALAFVALPSIWLFQVLLAVLAPVAELAILIAVFAGNGSIVLFYYVAFLGLDFAMAALAYALEGESPLNLLLLLPQRLFYRLLMHVVLARSLTFALRGRRVGWGKLERTATVAPPPQLTAS